MHKHSVFSLIACLMAMFFSSSVCADGEHGKMFWSSASLFCKKWKLHLGATIYADFFLLALCLEDDKHNHTIPVCHREIFLLFKGVNESNKKVLVTN